MAFNNFLCYYITYCVNINLLSLNILMLYLIRICVTQGCTTIFKEYTNNLVKRYKYCLGMRMRRKRYDTIIQLYPIVYGALILFGINMVCKGSCSIFSLNLPHTFIISRFLTLTSQLISNFHLVLLLIVLMLLEILRTMFLGEKIVLLFEALLLFLYSWSIEITLVYLFISYVGIKILQNFVSEIKTLRTGSPCCTPGTILDIDTNNILISVIPMVLGVCILMHVIYSYFLYVSILSMLAYLVIVTSTVFIALNECKSNLLIHSVLAAIPPFGIITLIHDIIMFKRISTGIE